MAQSNPSKEQSSAPTARLPFVLRILDTENRLLERADQKAISLLSALGVFMVFFVVYYRIIPMNAFTVVLLLIYFVVALMAIVSLILTVRPRIRLDEEEAEATGKATACEPAFFGGICRFPTLSAYREALEDMVKDESSVIDVYSRQIFNLARINAVKYRNMQRAVLLVVIALAVELTLVAYLFIHYHAQGASLLPSITG
jgi:hypothetical protein